jgi:two-component system nitrate/nitrite response regulator NarL
VNILSVLVSTDEPMVEVGVRTLLASDTEFNLLEVCRSHSELLQAASKLQPNVIVCGLSRETELNGIRELQRMARSAHIVMWARELSTELAHQAVETGVRGFLSTTASPEHFRECLLTAARGELWMESSLTMNLLNNRPVSLSKRQSELVGLLTQGLKNKEIATALGISEGTVKAYLTTLYEKVGARDRFELALFGLKNLGGRREDASAGGPIRSLVARRGVKSEGFSKSRGAIAGG